MGGYCREELGIQTSFKGVSEMILLVKLLEHNNWANLQIIEACSTLTDEQLDAAPLPTSTWSIRHTLRHLVKSQEGYVSLLTLQPRQEQAGPLPFAELRSVAQRSGESLLTLIHNKTDEYFGTRIQTTDGYLIELWVVMVQTLNHATDHRRQISRMLRILDVAPPDLDGWTFGEVTDAVIPITAG